MMVDDLLPEVVFAQPDHLPDVEDLGRGVVVLDISFALPTAPGTWPLSHPQTQQYYQRCLEESTLAFIHDLGDRLVLWVDHHDHRGWGQVSGDNRFFLRSGARFPACALLVDKNLFEKFDLEKVDTVVCHPDLDGLISAARFLLKGELPYPDAMRDASAADTRGAPLSKWGETLDGALKSGTEHLPSIILKWLLERGEDREKIIREAFLSYQEKLKNYPSITIFKDYRDVGRCRIADVRDARKPLPLTQILCDLQGEDRIGIVLFTRGDRSCIAAAGKNVHLPHLLDLPGGTPSRVLLDAHHLPEVVERLNDEVHTLHFPDRALVEVVRRCNLACPLCPVGNGQANPFPDMSPALFQAVINSFGPYLKAITLHNYGEPLLHPNLGDIIRRAKKEGISHVDLTTNGNILSPGLARELVESGLDRVRFSVDTSDPGAYRKYRRGGSLEKVLNHIQALARIRAECGADHPLIEAQALLMRENEAHASRFEEELLTRGADQVSWKTFNVFMSGIEMGEEGKNYLPSRKEYHRYASSYPEPASHRDQISLCTWPWDRLVVLADGTIVPCCHDFNGEYPLGKVREGYSARELWDTPARREFMLQRILDPLSISMCRRCSSAVSSLGLRKGARLNREER